MIDEKVLTEAEGGDPDADNIEERSESADEEIVSGTVKLKAAPRSRSVRLRPRSISVNVRSARNRRIRMGEGLRPSKATPRSRVNE